jgi:hypothetical protein
MPSDVGYCDVTFQIGPRQLKKHPKLADWYSAYLLSDKWKRLKAKIYKERGRICQLCHSRTNLVIHHLTYSRVMEELDRDLIIVCSTCHDLLHSRRIVPYMERIYDQHYTNDNKQKPKD